MTNKEIFRAWAPLHKRWVDWVRPVPFVAMKDGYGSFRPVNLVLPCLSSLDPEDFSTAVIVDLPGTQSVEAGILLAQWGFRPIPIYNGVMSQKGARATTDNQAILGALAWGAEQLAGIPIKDDAPPAFLTDANRLQRYKLNSSVFDNSWDVYHQDLPTEEYFIQNGISRILVIGNSLAKDLKVIFRGYPKKKLSIYWSNGYEKPKRFKYKILRKERY